MRIGCAPTIWLALALAGISPGNVPSVKAATLGELIYPNDKINENIDHLQNTLDVLIDKFGKTVGKETLKALERALAGIQSLRIAYIDVMANTVEEIGQQRAALLNQMQDQEVELEKFLDGKTSVLTDAVDRFNNTLETVTRASKQPWLMDYEPTLFRPDRGGPVQIILSGQHLDNVNNRLIVGTTEVPPSLQTLANKANFKVDRNLLQPDTDGFVKIRLRAPIVDNSWFWWWPWHVAPSPAEFNLFIRAVGPRLATYIVETEYPSTDSDYDVRTKELPKMINPVDEQVCIDSEQNEEFDPGYTKYTSTTNLIRFTARTGRGRFGYMEAQLHPAHTENGPENAVSITFNSPEKICLRFNLPSTGPDVTTELAGTLTYRVHLLTRNYRPARFTGEILWDKDESVVLPEGYRGFRATVNIIGSDRNQQRVFDAPQRYGPLEISIDPNSRTLLFRPNEVE
jgi:hypothetical protein